MKRPLLILVLSLLAAWPAAVESALGQQNSAAAVKGRGEGDKLAPAKPQAKESKTDAEARESKTTAKASEFQPVPDDKNACIACHTKPDIWDPQDPPMYKKHIPQMALEFLNSDVHWQKGLRCQDCHGGNALPEDPDNKQQAHQGKDNFRTVGSPANVPSFCGRCHSSIDYMRRFNPSARTDQLAEYWTSGHGKHLKEGDLQVANCISCHGRPHGNAVDLKARLVVTAGTATRVLEFAGLTTDGVAEHAKWKGVGGSSATLTGDNTRWTLTAGTSAWKAPATNYPRACRQPASSLGRQGWDHGDACRAADEDGQRACRQRARLAGLPHQRGPDLHQCHSDKKLMAGRTFKGKPLPCDEYAKWSASVHGVALLKKGDFSAPSCNNCHGNHGAAPPQTDSVANACGTCHGKIAKLFEDTKMRHTFEKEGLPGCATCHSNHEIRQPSDDFLGMQEGAFSPAVTRKGNTAPPSQARKPRKRSTPV